MSTNNAIKPGFSLALDKINGWIAGFYELLPNILVGLIILGLFTLGSWTLSRLIKKYFTHTGRADLGRLLADFSFWMILALGMLIVLTVMIPSLRPGDLLSSLGIGSLAFGFAFKDILQNWLSGLLILLRLPFRRGDQISVGEAEGTVQRIEPRATIIRTYDGRDIVVPNTTIYTSIVTVHTSQKSRRVEIDFTVGYACDIRALTKIIEECLGSVDEILRDPPPQVLCWELGATSLGLKLRWWIKPYRAEEIISRARAIQSIKEAFDANGIDLTDPQLVSYQRAPARPGKADGAAEDVPPPAEAPPEIRISKNDPEASKPKTDSKNETMLAESPAPVS